MNALRSDFQVSVSMPSSAARSHKSNQTSRDCPRVMVRFSEADYERLQELADGMALATFIRACALSQKPKRKSPRPTANVKDQQAIAQALGLLGQSRIANNLNQLAYHANIGALPIDDHTRGQINEAYGFVVSLRKALLLALGNNP